MLSFIDIVHFQWENNIGIWVFFFSSPFDFMRGNCKIFGCIDNKSNKNAFPLAFGVLVFILFFFHFLSHNFFYFFICAPIQSERIYSRFARKVAVSTDGMGSIEIDTQNVRILCFSYRMYMI